MAVDDNASLIIGGAQQLEQRQQRSAKPMVDDEDLRVFVRLSQMGVPPKDIARMRKLAKMGLTEDPSTQTRVSGENPTVTSAMRQAGSILPPAGAQPAPAPATPGGAPVRPPSGNVVAPDMRMAAQAGLMSRAAPPNPLADSGAQGEASLRAPPQQGMQLPSYAELAAPMSMADAELAAKLQGLGIKSTPEERAAALEAKLKSDSEIANKKLNFAATQLIAKLDQDWQMLQSKLATMRSIAANRNATAKGIAADRNATAFDIAAAREVIDLHDSIERQITSVTNDLIDPLSFGMTNPVGASRLSELRTQLQGLKPEVEAARDALQNRLPNPAPNPQKPSPKPAPKPRQKPTAPDAASLNSMFGK